MFRALSALLLITLFAACASTPSISPPSRAKTGTYSWSIIPEPVATGWYIHNARPDETGIGRLCDKDALVITISESPTFEAGGLVCYDVKLVPGLLARLSVSNSRELKGKRVMLADARDPHLEPIVQKGRECSERHRRSPLLIGRYYC